MARKTQPAIYTQLDMSKHYLQGKERGFEEGRKQQYQEDTKQIDFLNAKIRLLNSFGQTIDSLTKVIVRCFD